VAVTIEPFEVSRWGGGCGGLLWDFNQAGSVVGLKCGRFGAGAVAFDGPEGRIERWRKLSRRIQRKASPLRGPHAGEGRDLEPRPCCNLRIHARVSGKGISKA
jgi:hypothetical protein